MLVNIDGQDIDPQAQLLDLDRADCEESLYTFLVGAWPYIDPAPWTDSWAIEAIAEHLQAVCDGEIRNLLINIPPRCGKSSITSVAFPAWVWAQSRRGPTSGPTVPILGASYDIRLALRDSVKCRRLIESPWYQARWGHRFQLTGDQNTKSRFSNTVGGERLITSVGAGVTGEGGQIIITDDGNAANEAFSEASIQTTKDWWSQTMSTRLNDPNTGAFVNIQQRLAEDDLTGYILEQTDGKDWCHLMLPMRYESERSFITTIGWKDPRQEEGELLWPERFGEKAVATLENKLGKFIAAGQLQQRPEPAGGGVIKRDWWKLWDKKTYPPMDYILASIDTAYTEETQNDYSAMTIWGVFTLDPKAEASRIIDADGRPVYLDRVYTEVAPKIMLMYAWQDRLELHELVNKCARSCIAMKVDLLIVESKASGHSVAQEIRRLYSREKFGVQLKDPKSLDKLSRLYSVQHLFEEGIIYAPDKTWAEMVITQVGQFPGGAHDDLVDTTSQAIRHLRDTGMISRQIEQKDDADSQLVYPRGQNEPLYPA